jgi:hypothetical protein
MGDDAVLVRLLSDWPDGTPGVPTGEFHFETTKAVSYGKTAVVYADPLWHGDMAWHGPTPGVPLLAGPPGAPVNITVNGRRWLVAANAADPMDIAEPFEFPPTPDPEPPAVSLTVKIADDLAKSKSKDAAQADYSAKDAARTASKSVLDAAALDAANSHTAVNALAPANVLLTTGDPAVYAINIDGDVKYLSPVDPATVADPGDPPADPPTPEPATP